MSVLREWHCIAMLAKQLWCHSTASLPLQAVTPTNEYQTEVSKRWCKKSKARPASTVVLLRKGVTMPTLCNKIFKHEMVNNGNLDISPCHADATRRIASFFLDCDSERYVQPLFGGLKESVGMTVGPEHPSHAPVQERSLLYTRYDSH